MFSTASSQLDSVEIGDILVSDITPEAPDGYLRKVISITEEGDKLILETEQASLTDAVEDGLFELKRTFGPEDIILIDSSGVDISLLRTSGQSIGIKIKDYILYDEDNDHSTKNDQILFDSEIEMTPTIDIKCDIQGRCAKDFHLKGDFNLKSTHRVHTKGFEGKISRQFVIKTIQLPPLTIPGPIPLPFAKQWIVFVIGIDGSISAEIAAEAIAEGAVSANIMYKKDLGWEKNASTEFDFSGQISESTSIEGLIEPWFQVRYEARPFGLKDDRFFIAAKAGTPLTLTLDGTGTFDGQLDICIDLSAKAQARVFDRAIIDFEASLYERCWPLNNFTRPNFPPNKPNLIEPIGTTLNNVSVIDLKWSCDDPNDDDLTYRVFVGEEPDQLIEVATGLTQDSFTIGLIQNTAYYWEVMASDGTLETQSDLATFNNGNPSIPSIEWEESFGGSGDDIIHDIISTSDGGYLAVGQTNSNNGDVNGNHGGIDGWVVKMNAQGILQWSKAFGGSKTDILTGAREIPTGGYIISGYTDSDDGDVRLNMGGTDMWVLKLSTGGMIEDQKTYGSSLNDLSYDIALTNDGGFILAGSQRISRVSGFHRIYLRKIGLDGPNDTLVLDSTMLINTNMERAYSITQTGDGGFILCGSQEQSGSSLHDQTVTKITSKGVVDWNRTYGGSEDDRAWEVHEMNNGDFIVGANRFVPFDGADQVNVFRLNSSGMVVWDKYFGSKSSPEVGRSIQETSDGGFITLGTKNPGNGGSCWVIRLDKDGEEEWNLTFGGSLKEEGIEIVETLDEGFVFGGISKSNDGDVGVNHGGADFWIVKLK